MVILSAWKLHCSHVKARILSRVSRSALCEELKAFVHRSTIPMERTAELRRRKAIIITLLDYSIRSVRPCRTRQFLSVHNSHYSSLMVQTSRHLGYYISFCPETCSCSSLRV